MSDIRLVHEWLKYSQNDLISAKHLYEDLHLEFSYCLLDKTINYRVSVKHLYDMIHIQSKLS